MRFKKSDCLCDTEERIIDNGDRIRVFVSNFGAKTDFNIRQRKMPVFPAVSESLIRAACDSLANYLSGLVNE